MKKYLLLLAAGAVALPGLAIADAHGDSSSITGNIRVQHTQSKDAGVTTADTSTHSDDTYIRYQRDFTNSNAGDASAYIHFQPSGEWRYGVTASSTKDGWTVSGKGEWDFDMTNTADDDDQLVAESPDKRDSFLKASNASGFYFQLGRVQYGDQLRGYSNGHGGNVFAGTYDHDNDSATDAQKTAFAEVIRFGGYNGNGYLATNEARFTALQLGSALGGGLDVSLIMQTETDEALFGAYSNAAADGVGQTSNGNILQIKYAANNVDAIVQAYNGSQEATDSDASSSKVDASLTQAAIAYSLGTLTPFLQIVMGTVEQNNGTGTTTSYDASVTNLGLGISLANGNSINLSATTSSGEESTEGVEKESGDAYEIQYVANVAGMAIKTGYVTGEFDDGHDETTDDADTALSIRLDYGF